MALLNKMKCMESLWTTKKFKGKRMKTSIKLYILGYIFLALTFWSWFKGDVTLWIFFICAQAHLVGAHISELIEKKVKRFELRLDRVEETESQSYWFKEKQ